MKLSAQTNSSSRRCLVLALLISIVFLILAYYMFVGEGNSQQQQRLHGERLITIEQKQQKKKLNISICRSRTNNNNNSRLKIIFIGDSNTLGMRMMTTHSKKSRANSSANATTNAAATHKMFPYGGFPRYVFTKREAQYCGGANGEKKSLLEGSSDKKNANETTKNATEKSRKRLLHSKIHEYVRNSVYGEPSAGLAGYGPELQLSESFRSRLRSANISHGINLGTVPFSKTLSYERLRRDSEDASVDVAFLLLGTNEVLKSNSDESLTEERIYDSYRHFIVEDLLTSFRVSRVVVITPPHVMRTCFAWTPFCVTLNSDLLKTRVVPQLRKLVASLKEHGDLNSRVDLIDFFGYQQDERTKMMMMLKRGKVDQDLQRSGGRDHHHQFRPKNNSSGAQIKKNFMKQSRIEKREKVLAGVQERDEAVDDENWLKYYYQSDGVHLSEKGHAKLGELVWQWLLKEYE